MPTPRVQALIVRLEKGHAKTLATLSGLQPGEWARTVYDGPPCWDVRDLLAHFFSAEGNLLQLAQDVAAGGEGMDTSFDYNAFNAQEQERLRERAPQDLLRALDEARRATLAWVRTLDDSQLDRVGGHPGLGRVTLETMLTAIYGHQLLHMRDLKANRRLPHD